MRGRHERQNHRTEGRGAGMSRGSYQTAGVACMCAALAAGCWLGGLAADGNQNIASLAVAASSVAAGTAIQMRMMRFGDAVVKS